VKLLAGGGQQVKDFKLFVQCVVGKWIPLLTGGIAIAIVGGCEHWSGKSIPWWCYGSIMLFSLLWSCFLTWRDELKGKRILEEAAKPKLSIEYHGTHQRPEMQEHGGHRLFRVIVRNDSLTPITNAQLVLEDVESSKRSEFFPGHPLRAMGTRNKSPHFDILPGATQWVDLVGHDIQRQSFYVPFAVDDFPIPPGQHMFSLRAEGGGLPQHARVTVNCMEHGQLDVSSFENLQ
jgi:hypothetical protein